MDRKTLQRTRSCFEANIGRLCEIAPSTTGCGTASSPYATGYGYNAASQPTGFKYGNGIFASFGFSSNRLQLNCLDYSTTNRSGNCTHDATTKFGLSYSYGSSGSNSGQIAGITDSVDNGRSATYSYDALYRLSTAATTGSANYPAWGLQWTYDRYGNALSEAQTAGSPPSYSVTVAAASNHITGSPFAYDANGNMTNDGINVLTYDGENRVVTSTQSGATYTYSYDGNGLRVEKTPPAGSAAVYIFSGAKVIAEYTAGAAAGSPSTEYIYSGAQLVTTISGSTTTYQHADPLSARVSTDVNGNPVRTFGHYPFGEVWYETGTASKWKFTSYERDAESGNDYALARIYANRQGRFLSPDPLTGSLSNPQSLNRYGYSQNDPMNLMDPSGLVTVWGGCYETEETEGPVVCLGFDGGGSGTPDRLLLSIGDPSGGGAKGVDRKTAVSQCVKELFGIQLTSFDASGLGHNGIFGGQTADGKQITVTNDVNTFTVQNLNEIFYGSPQPPGGRGDIHGLTLSGKKYTNWLWGLIPLASKTFSLSTNYSGSNLSLADLLTTQIHELGHSLGQMLGLAPVGTEDPYGARMEDCVIQKMLGGQAKQ